MSEPDPKLVNAFYREALKLIRKIETKKWVWRTNYLRERVGVMGYKFGNSQSPAIYRTLVRQHPELGRYIKLNPLKAGPVAPPLFAGAADAAKNKPQ